METKKIKQCTVYNSPYQEMIHLVADKSVDVFFTDLPYNTTKARWDQPVDLDEMWNHVDRILKPNGVCLMFAQTPFDKILGASNLKMLRYEWIWEKTQATGPYNANKMPLKAHENILVFYKKLPYYNPQKTEGHKPVNSYTKYIATQNNTELYGKATKEISGGGNTDRYPRSVLTFASDKQRLHLHSTQKPLALIEYMLKTYCPPGGFVLDICAGSGTTGQGCNNLGFDSICVERDKKIYDDMVNRLETMTI